VIYCKFWELDEDHDFLIASEVFQSLLTQKDLQYYDNYSLNPLIIERILEGFGRRLKSGVKNKLNYEDFICN
jgi:serine/threonine-protein phosphatase 2A regulatory subunit B''